MSWLPRSKQAIWITWVSKKEHSCEEYNSLIGWFARGCLFKPIGQSKCFFVDDQTFLLKIILISLMWCL